MCNHQRKISYFAESLTLRKKFNFFISKPFLFVSSYMSGEHSHLCCLWIKTPLVKMFGNIFIRTPPAPPPALPSSRCAQSVNSSDHGFSTIPICSFHRLPAGLCSRVVFFFLVLNLMGWHWLTKSYRFQGHSSTAHLLYTVLCVRCPKSDLSSPVNPIPSSTSSHAPLPNNHYTMVHAINI